MELNDFKKDCIVVKWTQISNDRVIEDPIGDLYLVDIDKISDGNVRICIRKSIYFLKV